MSDSTKSVECGKHGTRKSTFVCQHLVTGESLGFHYATDDSDDPCPDAWCDHCENAFQAEGAEWNDRSEAVAGVKLLCDACYEAARARNWREDKGAFDEFMRDAVAYLEFAQADLRNRFRLSDYDKYHWDQDTGELVFLTGNVAKVIATIQFVGSVSTRSDTWLWSWANPSYLESVRAGVRKVRKYGEERNFLKLAAAHWPATEADGWDMAAVAAYLLGARGVYRTPGDNGFTFMVLTDVKWAQ
jgi:hypothetical protein